MSEWRESTWGDEISLEYGKGIRNYADANAPYRVYGSNGPVGWTSEPLAQGPGIILGRKGAYRGVRISREPFFVIDTAYYVVPKSDLDIRWLYYAIIHHKLGEIDDGSPIPSTTRSAVYVRELSVPQKSEQQAIASILSALDDKIELNRQMNETLEAMARAVFKDWFVDFGPTRAKTEGRAPYLAPDIWSLFPDRLDGEGMPVGWTFGSLADFASLNPESWSRANYPDTVEYVDLSNTKWGTIETVTPFASAAAPSRAQRILRQGDTIVGTVRPGNGSYAFVSQQGLTGSTGFAVLRPSRKIFREVVYLSATSKDNIDRLSHLADGGAYPAVRPELVAATALINAPSVVFSEFSATVSSLIDRVEANKQENRTLAATRDLLLPKLMSGEIRVREADKFSELAAP